MNHSLGIFLRCCIFATLASLPLAAWAQGMDAVTQVVPVASPSPSPWANPYLSPSPVASEASPSAAAVGGTAPEVSGTAPLVSGTGVVVSGSGTAAVPSPTPPSPYSIEIDLGDQRAYLLKDGQKVAESPISSGREGHLTPTGDFAVIQKDLNHFSNLYGKIVEKDSGRLVKAGADAAMPVPKGCKFVPAPMKWFMRFDGAAGMHAGILPGYAASHGCVRMPAAKAELFYETVDIGTPVHVFGTAPVRVIHEEKPRPRIVAAPKPTPTPKPKHGWWF
jgi:lipoprotein-anchoring transpeptidase ErfK/SrfK